MPRKHITQDEAHAYKRTAEELQNVLDLQRHAWVKEYPGGVHIQTLSVTDEVRGKIHVARKLEHAVVVSAVNAGTIEFYALPIGKGGA